jgi:hypothetical protein
MKNKYEKLFPRKRKQVPTNFKNITIRFPDETPGDIWRTLKILIIDREIESIQAFTIEAVKEKLDRMHKS